MQPKFCVGEEVMVRGETTSEYDIDRTEVIYSRYTAAHQSSLGVEGYKYKTAHQPDMNRTWLEGSLRKLPPEDRVGFEDCEWQPTGLTV